MRTPIPVRLPQDLVAWLDQQAESQSETRSTVIRQLLRTEMQRQRRAGRRRTQPQSDQQPHSTAGQAHGG